MSELLSQRSMVALRLLLLLATLGVMLSGCSRAAMSMNDGQPPTFSFSGRNVISSFEVINESGPVWRLYPQKDVTLAGLSQIRYGEVPASCTQDLPANMQRPPALAEGVEYTAVALIFDSEALRVRFRVKDNKVVVISDPK